MLSIEAPQHERLLDTLFRNQVQHHSGIREQIAHYQRCEVGHLDRCCSYLVRIVRQYLESRRQLQTKKELERGRGTSRMAVPAGDSNKGHCFNWIKHGACRYGRDCSYLHEQDRKGRSGSPQGKGSGKVKQPNRDRSSSPVDGNGSRSSRVGSSKPCHFFAKSRANTGASANFRTPSAPRRDREGRGQLQLRAASPARIRKANNNNNRIEAVPPARWVARQWIVLQWCSRSFLRQRKSSTY